MQRTLSASEIERHKGIIKGGFLHDVKGYMVQQRLINDDDLTITDQNLIQQRSQRFTNLLDQLGLGLSDPMPVDSSGSQIGLLLHDKSAEV